MRSKKQIIRLIGLEINKFWLTSENITINRII